MHVQKPFNPLKPVIGVRPISVAWKKKQLRSLVGIFKCTLI